MTNFRVTPFLNTFEKMVKKAKKKIKEQQGESTIWRAYRAKHTEMMCRVNGPFCIFSRVELQQS